MLSTSTGLPFAITATSTDQRFRLGELYETWDATYGPRIWRYVQNKSGSALAIGETVMQEDGTDFFEANLAGANTPKVRLLGVAAHAIANSSYGFVLAKGYGLVKAAAAGITANTAQITAASGLVTDWATGTDGKDIAVFAHALEAATSGNTARAKIDCL